MLWNREEMTTLNVIVINFYTQLTANVYDLAFHVFKFHIVSSAVLPWLGLVLIQVNNSFS